MLITFICNPFANRIEDKIICNNNLLKENNYKISSKKPIKKYPREPKIDSKKILWLISVKLK